MTNAINPHARQVHQRLKIFPGRQNLSLEATHLTGRCGLAIFGPTSDHLTHVRINREPFRVVRILVACEATVHRLAQRSDQLMLCVLATARIAKDFAHFR